MISSSVIWRAARNRGDRTLSNGHARAAPALPLAAFVVAFVLALALVASARAQGADGPSIRLTVALPYPPGVDAAGFYLAEARGLYAHEGLAVRFEHGRDERSAIDRLTDGAVDLALAWLPGVLRARADGRPVVEIARLIANSSLILACRDEAVAAGAGPAALGGRTVGRWTGEAGRPLDLWLATLGLDAESGGAAVTLKDQRYPLSAADDLAAYDCVSARAHVDADALPAAFSTRFAVGRMGAPLGEDGLYALAPPSRQPGPRAVYARFLRASAAGWHAAHAAPAAAARAVEAMGGPTIPPIIMARRLAARRAIEPATGSVGPPDPDIIAATAIWMMETAAHRALAAYPEGVVEPGVFEAIDDLPPPGDGG